MKILYSSTFFSAVLGILMFLNNSEETVEIPKIDEPIRFENILPHNHYVPDPEGKVKVDLFVSFGCDECRFLVQNVFKVLVEKYNHDNTIALKLHLIPGNDEEKLAIKATQCTGKGDVWLQMTNKIFDLDSITTDEINRLAQEMGLEDEPFQTCLNDGNFAEIEQAIAYKESQAIEFLPTITVNDTLLLGGHPLENIEREIRRAP